MMTTGLDIEQVREKFYRYSGEDPSDPEDRGRLCAQLCGECADRAWATAQRQGAFVAETLQAALESWAAAEAFYQLTLRDEAAAPQRVTGDGVRLNAPEASSRARELAEEKRRAAALALGEGGFYFGRV